MWRPASPPIGNMKNLPSAQSSSRKDTENSDLTLLLFSRGQLRNVPSFIMHEQSHCSAH